MTKVVIPDQPGLPVYDRVGSVPFGAALITAATGQLPIHQANAWVWTVADHPMPSTVPSSDTMETCVAGSGHEVAGTVARVTACVLAGTARAPTG